MPALRAASGAGDSCLALACHCLARLPLLARQPYRQRFLALLLRTGRLCVDGTGLGAAALAALAIVWLIGSLDGNGGVAVGIVARLVVREIAPLLAAGLVLLRVGTVLAAETAHLRVNGELRSLRLLGLSARDYLVLPAVCAVALASLVLGCYFQCVAVAGGIVLSGALLDVSSGELFARLAVTLAPLDLVYVGVKSLGFGAIVALVACHSGLSFHPVHVGAAGYAGDVNELAADDGAAASHLATGVARALLRGGLTLLLFNAALAYLVYGGQRMAGLSG